jgi:hypothetical protein
MMGQGKKVMGKKGQRSGKRNPIGLLLTVVVLFAGNFVSLRPASAQGSLTDQALIILDAADETGHAAVS